MMKKKPLIGVGMYVYFKSHVFGAPFAPFYDKYAGHKFLVLRIHDGGHAELEGPVPVDGYVDVRDLKQA